MRRAFTLVEMLVVIAVIAILAAILIPSLQNARANAQASQCMNNLKGLGVALNLYLADHRMILPTLASARKSRNEEVDAIDTILPSYLDDQRVFQCPADPHVARDTGTSYYWNDVLAGQPTSDLNLLNLVTDLSKIPLIFDKEGWHDHRKNKVNFLFADGHVAPDFKIEE